MTLRGILREGLRNVVSGTARLQVLVLLLSCLTISGQLFDLSTIRDVQRRAEIFRSSGAAVWTLKATGRIDAVGCDNLAAIDGVAASGAMRERAKVVVSQLPDGAIPTYDVTTGMSRVLGANSGGGALVSPELATTLGVQPGDHLVTRDGPVLVNDVYAYPNDGRRPLLSYALLLTGGEDLRYDECWVRLTAGFAQVRPYVYLALGPSTSTDQPPSLVQLNPVLGSQFDAEREYRQRLSRHGWIVVFLGAWLCGWSVMRLRRLELAAALHLGVRRSDLARILVVEAVGWIPATVALGLPMPVWFATSGGRVSEVGLWVLLGYKPVVAAVVGATAGIASSFMGTRENQLFDYFKNR